MPRISRCSYCSRLGHNIRGCNDPTIDILHQRLIDIYIENSTLFTEDVRAHHFRFAICIVFDLKQIKVLAVKYTNCTANQTKYVYAQHLCNYLSATIDLNFRPQVNTITIPVVTILPQEQEILWFIDRNPSTTLLGNLLIQTRRDAITTRFMPQPQPQNNKKYSINAIMLCTESESELALKNDCPICYEPTKNIDLINLNCSHRFCGECIKSTLESYNNRNNSPCCALCRSDITSFEIKNPEIYNSISNYCL